jgi:hypothetical protein
MMTHERACPLKYAQLVLARTSPSLALAHAALIVRLTAEFAIVDVRFTDRAQCSSRRAILVQADAINIILAHSTLSQHWQLSALQAQMAPPPLLQAMRRA